MLQATKEVQKQFIDKANFRVVRDRICREYVGKGYRPIDDDMLTERANMFLSKYNNNRDLSIYIPRDRWDQCSWTALKVLNYLFIVQELIAFRRALPREEINYSIEDTVKLRMGRKDESIDEKLDRWRKRPTKLPIMDDDKFSPINEEIEDGGTVAKINVFEPKNDGSRLSKDFNKMVRSSRKNDPVQEVKLGNVFWKANDIGSMRSAGLSLSTSFPIGQETLENDSWENKYVIDGRSKVKHAWIE